MTERHVDLLLRGVGAAVAVWAAVVLSSYAALMTPFRVGRVLVPVAVVLAVVGNVLLIRFAYDVTGSRVLGLLPGLVWVGLSFFGADRTTEGDLVLIQSNWVATVYLLAVAATVAGYAYRLLVPRGGPSAHRSALRENSES